MLNKHKYIEVREKIQGTSISFIIYMNSIGVITNGSFDFGVKAP